MLLMVVIAGITAAAGFSSLPILFSVAENDDANSARDGFVAELGQIGFGRLNT
jgi:hypothetical protein